MPHDFAKLIVLTTSSQASYGDPIMKVPIVSIFAFFVHAMADFT